MIKVLSFFLWILLSVNANASEQVSVGHGYAIFGDLKYKEGFENFAYANPDAPKGGSITFDSQGTFDSLNSFLLKGNKAPGIAITFESLMTTASDEEFSYYGLLAETVTVPKSKKWVEYKIRDEARWHDGTEVTAYDVKFTLETLKCYGDPNYKILYKDITIAPIKDPKIVRFNLANSSDPLQIAYTAGMKILPEKFFKDKDFAKYDEEPIMGSGPYKISEYKFGKFIEYERVKDYWGKNLNVNKGHYNFDKIKYLVFFDGQIAVENLKNGSTDFRQENVSRIFATSYNTDAYDEGRLIKEARAHDNPSPLQAIFINTRKPALDDINLRYALNQAFHFDWMNKALFYGLYKRIDSYFANSEFKAHGKPYGKELEILNKYKDELPSEVFTDEYKFPETNGDLFKHRENLTKALNRLLMNGYKIDDDSKLLISPITNKPVEIEIVYFMPQADRIYNAYKHDLAKIGINLKLRKIDQAQFYKRVQNFDFDLAALAFSPVSIPGSNQVQLWHSKSDTEGGYNLSGVNSKAIDAILERLERTEKLEEIKLYTSALDRILLWNYYTIPQFYSGSFNMVYWDKFGMPDIKPNYDIGVHTWWQK